MGRKKRGEEKRRSCFESLPEMGGGRGEGRGGEGGARATSLQLWPSARPQKAGKATLQRLAGGLELPGTFRYLMLQNPQISNRAWSPARHPSVELRIRAGTVLRVARANTMDRQHAMQEQDRDVCIFARQAT